jgi:tRNA G18 (ribose-2'-O)-methylase SpoU
MPALGSFSGASRLIALEGVGNPDNIGGVFRTALAFGVDGIILDPASADPLYRKAIRTSMGAALRMPFARVAQWPHGLDVLRNEGFQIVALTPDAGATNVDDFPVRADARLALLLGSEGDGLSAGVLRYADVRLRIPIDATADSLNVVVAAGVALHTLRGNAGR